MPLAYSALPLLTATDALQSRPMSESLNLIKIAGPEGKADLEMAIEALTGAHALLIQTAIKAGWPEDVVRRAALGLAAGAILDEEGVDSAIKAVSAELDVLKETAS